MDVELFCRRMMVLLPQLVRGFARHEHNYLSRGQITLPQLWTLEHLSHAHACAMNDLAQFLNISRPSCTSLIDRLISQGLVRREHDRGDRRIVRVIITVKGKRILENIWEQKRRMLSAIFGQISPANRAQYLGTLERVVEILSKQQPAPKRRPANPSAFS
jgi:DNA-binding MarR family transcriptional regulator